MELFDGSGTCMDKIEFLAADRLEQLDTFDKTQSAKLLARFGATSCERQVMQRAINTYGMQAQCDVAIEEMAELTKALIKIRRVADDYEKVPDALANVIEEIADVEIMVDQLKIMYGEKAVEAVRAEKLERLEGRLNEQSTATGKTAQA